MSEEIKAKLRRFSEELDKGNVDVVDEIFATDIVRHMPQSPDIKGLEASKQYLRDMQSTFPDRKEVIDEIIVEGSTSVMRIIFRGTNTGPNPLIPTPTGKQVTVSVCEIAHWEGGKIVEDWVYMDMLGMMQQLGIIPTQ